MDSTIRWLARRSIAAVAAVACTVLLVGIAPHAQAQAPQAVTDLQPGSQATDGAIATLRVVRSGDATLVSLHLAGGLLAESDGIGLRSHFYNGSCESFGTQVDQMLLDVRVGASGVGTSSARIPRIVDSSEAVVMVIHQQDPSGGAGQPWACITVPWPSQDVLDDQARAAARNQSQSESLAFTGSDLPGLLAVLGGALIVGGALFVGAASVRRRSFDG